MTPLEKQIRELFRTAGLEVTREDLSVELQKLSRDMADYVAREGNQYLVENGITDQGTLIGSSEVVPNEEGGYDAVWLAEHASWINYGTDPHSVSEEGVANIRAWVARKLKPNPEPGETKDRAIDRVTNAIVWNIRKHGSEPKPFVDVAVEKAGSAFRG